jgi:TonB family protein
MNRRIAASLALLAFAAAAQPALAQSKDFSLAKVSKAGTTTQNIAGSGKVQVHVLVDASGKAESVSVLKSTNHGDDAAATEIARSATYVPARNAGAPVKSFYDYWLTFNGKSVSTPEEQAISSGSGGGGNTAAIDALVRAGKYKDAIAKANTALLSSPGDPGVLQLLGVAQYYDNDYTDAAATFSRVQDIKKPFQPIAAQAFATGAVRASQSNPTQALDYANKAVSLSGGDATSKFSLGVAQLANSQNAAAAATLKGVHDQLAADGKADAKTKINVDQELLQAQLANNDSAGANATAAEMKQIDPSGGAAASHALSQHYLKGGSDAMTAGDFPTAAKDFDQAASSATGQDAVTANTFAAFAVMRETKPDYSKAKDYAQKAVTGAPDDAQANFALGLSYYGSYASSNKPDDKTQALTYLNKADQLAKAAGNEGLALQIEAQIKNLSH